jgi:hypothetical protein
MGTTQAINPCLVARLLDTYLSVMLGDGWHNSCHESLCAAFFSSLLSHLAATLRFGPQFPTIPGNAWCQPLPWTLSCQVILLLYNSPLQPCRLIAQEQRFCFQSLVFNPARSLITVLECDGLWGFTQLLQWKSLANIALINWVSVAWPFAFVC